MQENIAQLLDRLGKHPRAKLGFYPTPLYRLDRLSDRLGISLYIKRDDFSGISLFGGNKIRKLEYLMGDAIAKRCDTVVTYGATQSNHAMQTATACRRLGLQPVLYLNAYVEPDDDDIRSNLLLDRILGAEIHVVKSEKGESEADTEARCFAMGKEHCRRLAAQGHLCYDIPLGGASPVGSMGFAHGYAELIRQCLAEGITPDHVFSATGTGGTLAGMVAGHLLLGDTAQLIGVAVSKKNPSYENGCASLCSAVLEELGSDVAASPADFNIDRDYYAPGYEQPNEAASEAIRLLARTEGLLLDPVYTGKAFAGLLGRVGDGQVKPGSTVVFWHTGGATALFAEHAILGSIDGEG